MTTTRPAIQKAVFPVAGLGTRFLPATKAQPKEMLPIVDKPLIQYAVEEAYAAGIRHMIFVTGRSKRAIEDHFDTAYELENELEAAHKDALLALVRSIKPDDMDCSYVRQARMLGLGHAVLCAQPLVGQDPFAVLLADDLIDGGTRGCLGQMVDIYGHYNTGVIAVQPVPRSDTDKYGIVEVRPIDQRVGKIQSIVEKPKPDVAPSTLGVVGRYILPPDILGILEQTNRGAGGEIQLTDGIATLLERQQVVAYEFEGKRYDCGSKLGYLEATVEYALRHPELHLQFGDYLKSRMESL